VASGRNIQKEETNEGQSDQQEEKDESSRRARNAGRGRKLGEEWLSLWSLEKRLLAHGGGY